MSPPDGSAAVNNQAGQSQQQPMSSNPPQPNAFGMTSPNSLYGQGMMPQMAPMMQMQMQMNMPMNGQFAQLPQAQAMHQSVMRHTSPGPSAGNGHQQGYMGMGAGY